MANLTIPIQVNLPDDWVEQVIERLRNDPDADWVEVVRCHDCRWHEDQNDSTGWLPCMAIPTPDEFYCGYGVRKDEQKP